MNRSSTAAGLALLLCAAAFGGCRSTGGRAVKEVVRAERDFSATSARAGMKEAFLSHLAEDGIVFRPLPVKGKELWAARDSVPGTLIWEPSYVEVSRGGDLGVSLGPWEFRAGADTAHGHFHSIWKKEADGVWRVALDIGVRHPRPAIGLGNVHLVSGPSVGIPGTEEDAADVQLLDTDLSEEVEADGIMGTLSKRATTDVHWAHEGEEPLSGLVDVMVLLDGMKGTIRWNPLGGGLADSKDLGYTYGVAEHLPEPGAPADSSVYLHVWRHTYNGWHLSLSVETPL